MATREHKKGKIGKTAPTDQVTKGQNCIQGKIYGGKIKGIKYNTEGQNLRRQNKWGKNSRAKIRGENQSRDVKGV